MKTIKFKITDFNNEFMEKTILKRLESLDDFFDISLSKKTQELSISDHAIQHITSEYIHRERDWDAGHVLA